MTLKKILDQLQSGLLMRSQTLQNIHDQQITIEDVNNNEIDTLTHNKNVDPDNITIRIIGVTEGENTNEIKNTINNSTRDDDNPIKDHDYGYADTADDIEQTGMNPEDDKIRSKGVSTTDHDTQTIGVEDQTTPL